MRARAGRWRRSGPGLRWLLAASWVPLALAIGAPSALADDHEIAITDAGFDPATVTVLAGESVTWTNQSTAERAVVSDDGTLNSGPMGRGEAYGHVFDVPGTVAYFEAGNPAFRATIIVQAAPGSVVASPTVVAAVPPSSSPTAAARSSGRADNPALLVAVLAVSVIAIGAAATTLIAASRRPDR